MGLLDEAIREHLELKRRRGADPGAVAREEREVLAPALPAEPDAPQAVALEQEPAAGEHGAEPEPVPAAPPEFEPAAPAMLGEETAELDMQAAMDELAAEEDARAPLEPMPGQERMPFE
jgi:hypothetical protein